MESKLVPVVSGDYMVRDRAGSSGWEARILANFKAAYGLKITNSGDLFLTEKDLLG